MKKQVQIIALAIALLAATVFAEEPAKISIVPKPMEMKITGGRFELKFTTTIYAQSGSDEVKQIANYLTEQLSPATGYGLMVLDECKAKSPDDSILLTTKGACEGLGEEGYELIVTEKNITVRAPKPAGLFYGVQTIRQLLPAEIESKKVVPEVRWTVPCVEIKDKPRFGWRGSLLDCCRHFMTKAWVKRYIDLLAYHKMNRFHWHLTEDQGWRIEIKRYPRLTEVGAWRKTGPGALRSPEDGVPEEDKGKTYGGYYTQEDIKEVVAYAKSRYVMVVPEIEMPGHSVAALVAYPELSCTGGPFEVRTAWGVSTDVYCAGNDKVFEFLEDVLTEAIELFPSAYFHIGGDECPKDKWKKCPKCQQRIKAEGLENEYELQSYFIKRIEKFLLSKGRRLIGWDEILEGGLAPQATVQSWRGIKGAVAAAKSGHDTVVSPYSHCYFDYPHSRTPLKKTYSFEPIPKELTAEEAKHVLGGEGNLWTEHIPQQELDSWAYPRLTALAEVLWSPEELRDWEDFAGRMETHYKRFDVMGVDQHRGEKP